MTIASSRLGSVRMMSISRMIAISINAAKKSGDQPERRADQQRQRHDGGADQQRQPRAVDEARKHVAADRVGAERMGEAAAGLPERRFEEARCRW